MLPHSGEYIAFKLDPVASLEALNDPEVCEVLETKTYVSCVTYLISFPLPGVEHISVSKTLLSKGLTKDDPDRLITSDMSNRERLFHGLTATIQRSPGRNAEFVNVIIGGAWPQPKYGLSNEDQVLLDRDYFDEDSDRRELLKTAKAIGKL
ncbi:uncharacterized protein ARMOST_16929 [Armillaria ostoyae]|uniref:Uncharacterized protein n=1 Tax=Armillaria ostoyae TaxID=47428 RepID=A0A284RXK6_ARMOS|nr:uncharacterized protein ARMOST_16929 [Armillaria ostoyae]